MWSLNLLLLLSCAIFCMADSEETVSPASVELTENNFDEETNARTVLVTYYSPKYVSFFCHIFYFRFHEQVESVEGT